MYNLEYAAATETGKRLNNEDSFLIFENDFGFLVSVIADGMGGHKGGSLASRSIVKLVKRELKSIDFKKLSDEGIEKLLMTIIRTFQKDLKRVGLEFPEFSDMGSTLNMNIFSGKKMYSVNIGDSRTQSFIRKKIMKVTNDHNLATLAESDERFVHYRGQTNILTSSLGPNKNTSADFFITELESKNGYIIMTSDGVHNFISEISWMKILKSPSKSLEYKVEKVIKTALENGSNDNMTFILIRYENNNA